MRSTMESEKLNSLMFLFTQNDIAVEIYYNEVINDFLFKKIIRCTSTMTVTQQRIRMSKTNIETVLFSGCLLSSLGCSQEAIVKLMIGAIAVALCLKINPRGIRVLTNLAVALLSSTLLGKPFSSVYPNTLAR
ncbi:UNVERIFIED_CONTAM: hypothetical protein NCL1_46348 [Trichonephila clavipes]